MNPDPETDYAVISGDIVDSSSMATSLRKNLQKNIREVGAEVRKIYHTSEIPYLPHIFAGDSWQVLVSTPALSPRVAVHIRSLIRTRFGSTSPTDTRIALGIGKISFISAGKGLADADGEAFRLAGRHLQQMDTRCFDIILAQQALHEHERNALSGIAGLVDAIMTNWTKRQGEAVCEKLAGRTQKEIAATLNINQSGVARHLHRASWDPISAGLDAAAEIIDHRS